jgi:hypothetical protein
MTAAIFLVAALLTADFSQETGKIRPELHSSGFGPLICSCPQAVIDDIRSMGFKAARTHDWALLNKAERVCDYYHVFPLAHLDAKDPRNYVFGPTDYLLRRTREETGLDVFFRLGASIEHSGPKVHFNTLIPEDFDKVAEVFAATIRHYNRGWADGYEWDVRYWEVWNEPDGVNNMWCLPDGDRGEGDTAEARVADQDAREKKRLELFARFFATCLRRIKGEFGDTVKVGGPALCSWRKGKPGRIGTGEYFRRILEVCRESGAAPDFISWHYYGNSPDAMLASVDRARKICDDAGFPKCELVVDEWHYLNVPWEQLRSVDPKVRARVWKGPASHNGIDSSCFNLTLLSRFQTSKLDQAYYYGCSHTGSWGYRSESGEKYKVYYGLKLFGELVRGYPVMCASGGADGVAVLAAKSADGARRALLVSDYRSGAREISVDVAGVAADAECEVSVHDAESDLDAVRLRLDGGRLVLPKRDAGSAAFLVRF